MLWSIGNKVQILAGLHTGFSGASSPVLVPGYCAGAGSWTAEELRFVSSVRWLLGEAEQALCGLVSSSRYCCI